MPKTFKDHHPEWHACNKCFYVDGKCKNCGRPKGTAKGWRPAHLPQDAATANPIRTAASSSVSGETLVGAEPACALDAASAEMNSWLTQPVAAPSTAAKPGFSLTLAQREMARGLGIRGSDIEIAVALGVSVPAEILDLQRRANDGEALTLPKATSAAVEVPQPRPTQTPCAATQHGSTAKSKGACSGSIPIGSTPTKPSSSGSKSPLEVLENSPRLKPREQPASASLDEHSPLGGSGAERYMECSASVELIRMLRPETEPEEPDWTVEGTNAHLLGARCLELDRHPLDYIGMSGWEFVTLEMAAAVGVYVDYVRSLPGRMLVEYRMHRPEIHRWYYGTLDCCLYTVVHDFIEIIDYKNGAGVIVEVVNNAQLKFYAAGIILEQFSDAPRDMPVKLTIVQPNAWHDAGKIRSWTTTVGEILDWLQAELVPAMNATQAMSGWFFSMGEHCRFCPAKLGCPAFANLVGQALVDANGISGTVEKPVMPAGWKPQLTYEQIEVLKMYISAWRRDKLAALLSGGNPQELGAKLVYGKVDRIWKQGADDALRASLGAAAYAPPKLISPAVAEKMPNGKAIVAQYAIKPDGNPTLAGLNDKRTPATPNLGSAVKGEAMQKALAQYAEL